MIEALLILVCAAAATALFVRAWPGPGRAAGAVSIAGACLTLLALEPGAGGAASHAPPERPRAGYTSSKACRSCHPGEYQSWHQSFHRTMTQVATPETVLAPLDGPAITVDGRSIELARQGDEVWATLPEPDRPAQVAPLVRRRVVMTTGSHHYQAYWVLGSRGNELRLVPVVYLLAEQRFIPRRDAFLQPPSEHARAVRWNNNCVMCHSVAGRPQHDEASDRFATEAVELGIACEACHGPGEAHVARHKSPIERWSLRLSGDADDTIVHPGRLDAERASQVCGQCHAYFLPRDEQRWWQSGFAETFSAGQGLDASRLVLDHEQQGDVTIDADFASIFWPDGTIRVGGREYNGLVRSACFERGQGRRKLSCLSCHSMHDSEPNDQLAQRATGDGACGGCHSDVALQGTAHTHHPIESSGSRCYACHMPFTSYALFKGIRSHRIDSPSVLRHLASGRPNACNLCHVDRSLSWTAAALEQWYGKPTPPAAAEHGERSAIVEAALAGDAAERAIAAYALGRPEALAAAGENLPVAALAELLADPYSAVRLVALRALRAQPGLEAFDYDFLAEPAQRQAAVRRARELTHGRGPDQATIAALSARRDDRPIVISE